ncbi:MAG: hypothetical protein JO102_02335 [Elusimicrobia bacterium]|nr:hypothetical protein [Elusimicrobiota bacterium]
MNTTERTTIADAIHLVFSWIRDRKPGPGTLDWLVAEPPAPIVIDISFPSMEFTAEEDEFLPPTTRVNSMNGDTPNTLRPLEQALTRLSPIGGEVSLEKMGGSGLTVRIAIPAAEGDIDDSVSRIAFIQDEIRRELNQDEPGENEPTS